MSVDPTPLKMSGGETDAVQAAREMYKAWKDLDAFVTSDEFDLGNPDHFGRSLLMNYDLEQKAQRVKALLGEE